MDKPKSDDRRWITIGEAARLSSLSTRTIERMISGEHPPWSLKVGGSRRIHVELFNQWLDSRCRQNDATTGDKDRQEPTDCSAKDRPGPPDSRALDLIRCLQPLIYTDTQGKPVFAMPPEYMPVLIHSQTMRGLIASLFEQVYNPELLKDAAVRRVEGVLAGYALKAQPPPVATPLDPLREHDPVFLAVYYRLVKHYEEKQGERYKEPTKTLMDESRTVAINSGLPDGKAFHDVQAFRMRMKALNPDFLRHGLKIEFSHKRKGSFVDAKWEKAPPDDEDKGDGSSQSSPGKPGVINPLRRRDGSDASDVIARLAARFPKDKKPDS